MKVGVISSAPFIVVNNERYAYGPYVKELNIWAQHSDELAFMCPVWTEDRGLLISKIDFPVSHIYEAREFTIKGFFNIIRTILFSFRNFYNIYRVMSWADHIHLRCPGNLALMGCLVQIFFPEKPKTAKYAGNWDPNARQPSSYRLQKWILSNTFLTRNMQVLVYGKWEGSSKNIKPFFTATYRESDKIPVVKKTFDSAIKFLFVGTLSHGKRPLYAIQLVESLSQAGHNVMLDLYGEGKERKSLEQYINSKNLGKFVTLKGNQPEAAVRIAYQESHFLLLPSQSEGWPKVVAEAMFWGCLPVATKVSCVPFMLDHGNRGIIAGLDLNYDVQQIASLIENPQQYSNKITESVEWSRKYTLDVFEHEVEKLLMP